VSERSGGGARRGRGRAGGSDRVAGDAESPAPALPTSAPAPPAFAGLATVGVLPPLLPHAAAPTAAPTAATTTAATIAGCSGVARARGARALTSATAACASRPGGRALVGCGVDADA